MGRARNWTEKETEYLCDNWGTISIPHLAKKLNRSENAIIIKARQYELGAFLESGDYVTWHQLLLAISVSGSYGYKTTSWIDNRDFPVKTKRVRNNSFKIVYLNDFWKWAEKNQTFIDFSSFEENALGQEPNWVKAKRANDIKISKSFIKTPWTKQEDEKLIKLLKDYKYTYFDLSQKLTRTEGAIQRRICDLGIKERPLKADNHNLWTDQELNLLAELIKQGYKYEMIAPQIGKSAKAIRGKVYTMYLTEDIDKARRMLGSGQWGDGRPERQLRHRLLMTVPEKEVCKKKVSMLAYILLQRAKELSPVGEEYKEFWQKDMCKNWDDVEGCKHTGGCDTCTEFIRIRE
ncbi:MAG: hypothetical protein RSD42_06615, partial [Oscillospiraceae bacterium]